VDLQDLLIFHSAKQPKPELCARDGSRPAPTGWAVARDCRKRLMRFFSQITIRQGQDFYVSHATIYGVNE
jgi:hypothetical protein